MNSLTILTLVIIAAANMAVGGCIGICGIAGFLLPMLYTGGLGFDVTYALALSFLAFLVSGIIGSFNYYKAGNLDVKMSLKLGIGSLIGAIAGVFLQSMIEKSTAKTILYLVVLFSLRCRRPGPCDASSGSMRSVHKDRRRCGTF